MARLPQPGGDDGTWGQVLNDFLSQSHTANGALKPGVVQATNLAQNAVSNTALASSSVTDDTLAVSGGTDGQVLTKDSTQSGGIAWETVDKTTVGLGNVDNTADLDKPISTATQAALNTKADSGDFGSKVLLIDNAAALPPGTPAGVIVVVKS